MLSISFKITGEKKIYETNAKQISETRPGIFLLCQTLKNAFLYNRPSFASISLIAALPWICFCFTCLAALNKKITPTNSPEFFFLLWNWKPFTDKRSSKLFLNCRILKKIVLLKMNGIECVGKWKTI